MLIEIGHVEAIFRYPVKSMGGERRCQKARSFMHRIEQCHRCGQLLLESGSRFQLELKDNTAEVQNFIEAVSPSTASRSLPQWIGRLVK
jgi:hypothetical protein